MRAIVDPIAILVLILFMVYIAFIGYRYWFDVDRFMEGYWQRWEKMPKWFPFRGLYLNETFQRAWIWIMRIYTLVALLISAALLLVLLN